jgi:endonuclease/exonuclease/phosphatase family metal-dependent hydrolase
MRAKLLEPPTKAETLRVISANCEGANKDSWGEHVDLISRLTVGHPNVFVMLQECCWGTHLVQDPMPRPPQLVELEQALNMHGLLAVAPNAGHHTVLLHSPAIEQATEFNTTGTAEVGHALGVADFRVPGLTLDVRAASVHLSPPAPERRLIEVPTLAQKGLPRGLSILAGDFNWQPLGDSEKDWSDSHQFYKAEICGSGDVADLEAPTRLAKMGYFDAAVLAAGDAGRTPTAHGIRRDCIYVSERMSHAPYAYRCITEPVERGWSDHAMIVVDLDLSKVDEAPREGWL